MNVALLFGLGAGSLLLLGTLTYGVFSILRLRSDAALVRRQLTVSRAAQDAAQAQFAGIVELSEDAIISVDAEQRITLFNHAAEQMFGYRLDEVRGWPLEILLPDRFHASHRRHVSAFAGSTETLRPMGYRGTLAGRRKDGTEFPLEASITKSGLPAEPIFTARIRDITDRRRAEEGLQRLAAIVESSQDAIIGKGLDGTILTWNPAASRLYGYTAEEAVGRNIAMLTPADRGDELADILARLRQGNSVAHWDTVRVRKDGRQVDISLSAAPIRDAAGQIVGASAISRDITEWKRLETQIRQTQKLEAIGTLAGGIAHDFNNLLAAMLGNAEIAADLLNESSQAWQPLQELLGAGRRARDLVRQILTFSRQTGDQARRPLAVQDLIREVLQLLRASLPSTIAFRQHLEPGRSLVLADSSQLHQVLVNLCTNAAHAMRGQGGLLEVHLKTVEVDAEFAAAHPPLRPGTHVKLSVRDTGHGMAPEVRDRIFEPFFTTKGSGDGTGMGLAVVHGIVAGHDGAITVESAPGRGTRFDIFLPRCDAREDNQRAIEAPARGQKEHILFVDDEPALVRIWTTTLHGLGYRVTGRTEALEALETFRDAPDTFDLVVTDQTMPQLTGEALAEEITRIRPDVPVILCTGYSMAMTPEAAAAHGIQAYLMKPVSRRDLCLAIQRLLGDRAARAR
jgi:PAS domain S-box-containing protein